MKSIKTFGIIYVISSIFIGPSIVFYALGRGKDGIDCSEGTWDAITESAKAAYYHEAAIIMALSSAIMLGLGSVLIFQLLKGKKGAGAITLSFLIGIIMVGYLLILVQANNWNC